MSQPTLGEILTEKQERDAIHIAIAPVVCGDRFLNPGQRIGLEEGSTERVSGVAKHIGIVDPFLTAKVKHGQAFYMFLFPNTITALRHAWTHPAFEEGVAPQDSPELMRLFLAEYYRVIEDTAAMTPLSAQDLLDAATDWVVNSEYLYDNTESYKEIPAEQWIKFWEAFEKIQGMTVEPSEKYHSGFFTCSC